MKRKFVGKYTAIEELPFYKDYLSQFITNFDLVIPVDVEMSAQDCDFLMRLVMGSISSSYYLELDEEWKSHPLDNIKVHLRILTDSDGVSRTKLIDELCTFQIERLFGIYLDEQIELQIRNNEEQKKRFQIGPVIDFDDDINVKYIREEKLREYEIKVGQIKAEADLYRKIRGIINL